MRAVELREYTRVESVGFLISVSWVAVAQWLERATDNRVVAGSNAAEAVWKFGNFLYPTLPVSFGRDTIWCLCQGK